MSDPPTPRHRRAEEVAPSEVPGLHGLLFVAVAVVVVAGLYLGRSVLIPITLAMLLSFLLAPLVGLLRRLYCGRVPSVLIAVLLALTVILALGGLIGTHPPDEGARGPQKIPSHSSRPRDRSRRRRVGGIKPGVSERGGYPCIHRKWAEAARFRCFGGLRMPDC